MITARFNNDVSHNSTLKQRADLSHGVTPVDTNQSTIQDVMAGKQGNHKHTTPKQGNQISSKFSQFELQLNSNTMPVPYQGKQVGKNSKIMKNKFINRKQITHQPQMVICSQKVETTHNTPGKDMSAKTAMINGHTYRLFPLGAIDGQENNTIVPQDNRNFPNRPVLNNHFNQRKAKTTMRPTQNNGPARTAGNNLPPGYNTKFVV